LRSTAISDRSHLAIAKVLDEQLAKVSSDGQCEQGYVFATEDIAAHLRKGDYLPGADWIPNSVR
jgi:hypothetical protein